MCRKTCEWIMVFGGTKKDCNCNEGDSERDESTEEQLQYKQQYIYALPGTLFPAMWPSCHVARWPHGHICDMRYAKSLTPSPTVAMLSYKVSKNMIIFTHHRLSLQERHL